MHQKWNNERALVNRLVNRERFTDFCEHQLDAILPSKYLSRKEKLQEEKAVADSLMSSKKRRVLQRKKKRQLANLRTKLPQIRPNFERNLPPSRRCTREVMMVAAANGPALERVLSPTASSDNSGSQFLGTSMLPVHKPLTFSDELLGKKIERWVQNQTGADVVE